MTRSSGQSAARRREILTRGDVVPPLPELVVRLLALLGDAETEPHHVEAVLRQDPVLTGRLLAMVNSPWFGLNRPIETPREAVMIVGFRSIRTLVIASSTAKFLQRDYAAYGHDRNGLWAHAVGVAAASKQLGRALGLGAEAAEALFVAGLLHDIGMLLLAPLLRDQPDGWLGTRSVRQVEQEALGIDHTEGGALVAAKWNLSTDVQAVIAGHHDATLAQLDRPIAIVYVADALAEECGIGFRPGRARATTVGEEHLAALSLSPAQWPALRTDLVAAMRQAHESLTQFGGGPV